MVSTGFALDLSRVRRDDVASWSTKTDAGEALKALRASGLNCERDIEAHPAQTRLWRFWVIGRPDHFNGITYLMTADGRWVPGRLTDVYSGAVPWTALPRDLRPAALAHVTRTVPDSVNRRERYRTKSNGSCGRWVYTDESVALCVCGWKSWASSRDEARSAARLHRAALSIPSESRSNR